MSDYNDLSDYEAVYVSSPDAPVLVKVLVCRFPETREALKALVADEKEMHLFDGVGKKAEQVAVEQCARLGVTPDRTGALAIVHGMESYGSTGKKGYRIQISQNTVFAAAYALLDNDHKKHGGALTPKEQEGGAFSRLGSDVERLITSQAARLDPKTWEAVRKTKADFEKAFTDAGLPPLMMEPIENGYWPDAYVDLKMQDPWYLVKTDIGVLKIGWRKRVITLHWDETSVASVGGPKLFPAEKAANFPTLGEHYIHAYSYEKATEYLTTLKRAAQGA